MSIRNSLTYKAISNLEEIKFRSPEDFTNYLRFLADTGNLDILSKEMDEFLKFSHMQGAKIDQEVVVRLARFYRRLPKGLLLKDIMQLDQMCSYILNYNLVDENLRDRFVEYIVPNLDIEVYNHTENMMLAFVVIKLLSKELVPEILAIKLIKFFAFCKRRNNIRSDYIIIHITEYALNLNFKNFFKLGKRYNHLQNILARIYHSEFFLSKDEKRIFSQRILNQTYIYNDLSLPFKPRVAICISGIYRGHEEALKSIKKVADELDADIYMHTWDQTADWPGIGGTPSFIRLFGKDNEDQITAEFRGLNNILRIKESFPNTYEIISKPIYSETNLDRIQSFLGPSAKIVIENQDDILKYLIEEPHDFNGRGGLNQLKMFYGIKKSFEMALKNNNYDYIIRSRPDVILQENFTNLEELQKNTFYGLIERVVGFTDLEFLISNEMATSFVNMVDQMIKIKRLSPYNNLPKYDSHLLIFSWILHNKYEISQDLFLRKLMDSSHFNKFNNIESALVEDVKKLSKNSYDKYIDFINFFIKYCKLNPIDITEYEA